MAENFARQAIADVRAELRAIQRKRGKKTAPPVNPVRAYLKQRRERLDKMRPIDD